MTDKTLSEIPLSRRMLNACMSPDGVPPFREPGPVPTRTVRAWATEVAALERAAPAQRIGPMCASGGQPVAECNLPGCAANGCAARKSAAPVETAQGGVVADSVGRVVLGDKHAYLLGSPAEDDEAHNCDQMGCSSFEHVLARVPYEDQRTPPAPVGEREEAAHQRFLAAYFKAAESSQPSDWYEAALLAKQWECEVVAARALRQPLLAGVPEGCELLELYKHANQAGLWCALLSTPKGSVLGTGPTPEAALADATQQAGREG